MLAAWILSGALTLTAGVKPPDYTERSLCELWAGAQCQVAKCDQTSADARCKAESKKCKGLPHTSASKDHAAKVSECAKALLKKQCSDAVPAECSDVTGP